MSNLVARRIIVLSIFLTALRHLLTSSVVIRVIVLGRLGIFCTSVISRVTAIRILLFSLLLIMFRLKLKCKAC